MPLDDTTSNDFLAQMCERLERAGVLNDPGGTSRFMMIRGFSNEKRRCVMQFLHPQVYAAAA
jgi:hypothetical protein